jgi:5-methylcytosine-specific restriction endonuclease McrA
LGASNAKKNLIANPTICPSAPPHRKEIDMAMRLTKTQRTTLHGMFAGCCAYCGEKLGDRWHADHFEAIERKLTVRGNRLVASGKMYRPEHDTIANFRPSCAPCNISKGPESIENWRVWLVGHVAALNAHNTPYRLARKYGLIEETGKPVVFHFECIAEGAPNA